MPSYKRARQIVNHNAFDKIRKSSNGNVYGIEFYGDTAIRARELFIDMPLSFLKRKYRLWESMGADTELSHRARRFTKDLRSDSNSRLRL